MGSCRVGGEGGFIAKHGTRRPGGFILVLRFQFVGIEDQPNRNLYDGGNLLKQKVRLRKVT